MKSLSGQFSKAAGSLSIKVLILLMAALGSTSLVSSSVYAILTAKTTTGSPESISTGTITLTMTDNTTAGISGGFTTPITNMGIGDVANRYVNIYHGGTLTGGKLVFANFINEAATALALDPTNGLYVAIRECTIPWTVTGVCPSPGVSTLALQTTSIFSIGGFTGSPMQLALSSMAPGVTNYLKFSFRLPIGNNENVIDGVFPTGTVQGLTQTFNWIFMETPANAVTNS